jgi:ABC-type uncharacterized transport system ATPase component
MSTSMSTPRTGSVVFQNVRKQFGSFTAIHDLSLTIEPGTLVTLLGPSGCGKTTTLRMLAGLEHPSAGRILIGGKDVTMLPANERDVSMVFQSYALFPHMSALDNVAYGLESSGIKKKEARERAEEGLQLVGLGGLGHMGVKIAHALGAEVTVLSQSLRKQDDGLKLGADHFYATSDPKTFTELAGTFDLVISTVSAPLDFDAYLSLVRTDGALVNVGAPEEPVSVGLFSLIGGRKTLAGSMIGGIAETQEMLDFCAAHGLGAEIEVISADRINEAYERVIASDVRYRFVIDTSTI